MTKSRKKQLKAFIKTYQIPNISLDILNFALTHKSYVNDIYSGVKNIDLNEYNERLEFLGDAVLSVVISKALYEKYPQDNEGSLTKKKAQLVCESTLFAIGKELNLKEVLKLSKGELLQGGAERSSNISNAVEALIGAIFLNKGYKTAERFILLKWKPYLQGKAIVDASLDYKSKLQEYTLKKYKVKPEYKIIQTTGPDHKKKFKVGLYFNQKLQTTATEFSKKKAEQLAAKNYLKNKKIKNL